MKNSTKIFYTLGKIFTILEIVGLVALLIVGIVSITSNVSMFNSMIADGYSHFESPEQVKAFGVMAVVFCCIAIVIESAVLALAAYAKKAIANDAKNTTPHIMMIIVGLFSNIFYLLGGVFGLVATDEMK